MKSRKIKAIFASVLTVALLATAMTGFAANVRTTTTYNTDNEKIEVTTNVTDVAGSEVTYLVKSGATIVYIDQETAVNGAVNFDYKIAKGKMSGYSSTVTFGSNASGETFTGDGSADLGIAAVNDVVEETYTITYVEEAAGYGENVTAHIAAQDGHEITEVKVGDTPTGKTGDQTIEVGRDAVITVRTAPVEVEAAIQVFTTSDSTENSYVAVIQKVGTPYEVGVKFDGELYPSVESGSLVAVKLVLPAEIAVDSVEFAPYFIAEQGRQADTTSSSIK